MRKALILLNIFLTAASALASGPSFTPDVRFTGPQAKGWNKLGQANWSADAGTITGKPTDNGSGWLLLDHSYQDVSFYTEFRCEEGCETGVLLRAENAEGPPGHVAQLLRYAGSLTICDCSPYS